MIVSVAEDIVFADVLGVTLADDGTTRVPVPRKMHRWTVTIDTAPRFRMVIEECPCALKRQLGIVYHPGDAGPWSRRDVDYVRYADRVNCTCPYAGNKCARGFTGRRADQACHRWHRPKVDALVTRIGKPVTVRQHRTAMLNAVTRRSAYVKTDFDRLVDA